MIFKKAQFGLLLTLIVSLSCASPRTTGAQGGQKPFTDYDLLVVVSSAHDWEFWSLVGEPYSWTTYIFDTETWEFTELATNDMPVPNVALSPDAQHLVVLRETDICVVNRQWQTEFCLPPDADYVGEPRALYKPDPMLSWRSPRLFWEPDSSHFWILKYQPWDALRPVMVDVNVAEGTIEREIVLGETWSGEEPLRLHDFSAASHVALLEEGKGPSDMWEFNPFYLYDIETGAMRLCKSRGFLSPDGQRIAYLPERNFDEPLSIGEVTDLDDNVIQEMLPAPPGESSDFPWQTDYPWQSGGKAFHDFVWSHNGRMLAFRIYLGYLTNLYSLNTNEARILRVEEELATMEWAELFWSPDDSAIARISHFTMNSGDDLDIVTPNGDYFPIITDLSEGLKMERRVFSATWVPDGWLENDTLAE